MTRKQIRELRKELHRIRPDWSFTVNHELQRTKAVPFEKRIELGPELMNLDVGYRESFVETILLLVCSLEEAVAYSESEGN